MIGLLTRVIACVVLGLCLSFFGGLRAEESHSDTLPQHPLSITELVDVALSRHPSTQRTWWNAQRAAAAIGSAQSSYYPKISAMGEASRGEVYPKHGQDTRNTQQSAHLALDMMLFDFGATSAAVSSAKASLQEASWETNWNVQQVLLRVFEAYYAALHAQEVYDAALLSLSETEKMADAAEELNRVGLKPISNVYTSRAKLSRAQLEQSERKISLLTTKARLAVNIGVQANTPFSLQTVDLENFSATQETLEQLLLQAHAQRADLQAKREEYQAELSHVEKVEKSFWPTLSLFAQTGNGRTTTRQDILPSQEKPEQLFEKTTRPPSRQVTREKNYSIGLRLSVPLFTGFDATYQKRQALAAAKRTQAEIAELAGEISYEVAAACYSLEETQKMFPNAERNLENTVKAYESTFERYALGEATMVELSDAQEEVSAARIRYSDVKIGWLTAIAKVAYATGTHR